jgi:D-alanyl-D-alanine carboxypeptidase
MLIDAKTGLVLYAEDADYPWAPASLTKLMTAYLVFEAIRDGRLSPEETLVCSEHALNQDPSKMGLPVGSEIKVSAALKAIIIKSANDVSVMFAEKLSGSETAFVAKMNETAKRLGMTATTFINASGLPGKNADGTPNGQQAVTTARDMAILAHMILKEFPEYADLFSLHSFKAGNRFMRSHNSLLRTYQGADGMKTGFICASGYNVVASATREGRQLIAVVMGEMSGGARAIRAAGLFEHGFANYKWKALFSPTLDTLPVAMPDGARPPDLRPIVCRAGRGVARKKKAAPKPVIKKAAAAKKKKP